MNEKIRLYIELLKKWQVSVNLISPNTLAEIETRHIIDSLQLKKFFPAEAVNLIDIGTGAGLPGIPLAIESGLNTFLVESDRKKCLFLEEIIRQTGLFHVKTVNSRIENAALSGREPGKTVITARALADIKKLLEIIKSLLENNRIDDYTLILPKGKNADAEIGEARKSWRFDFAKYQSTTDSAAAIIVINRFEKL